MSGQGCQMDQGAMLILEVSTTVHVKLESAVCVPATVTFSICQPERRRGLGWLCLCLCQSYVQVLSTQQLVCVRLCHRPHQCYLCVYVWVRSSASLFVEPANGKAAAASLSPGSQLAVSTLFIISEMKQLLQEVNSSHLNVDV